MFHRGILKILTLIILFYIGSVIAGEPLGPSSRRTPLVISEIMYHPPDRPDGKNLEYVELYNSQPWFEDISGYRLDGDVTYQFPAGTVLAANAFVVIGLDPSALKAVHAITNVLGPYLGLFPNSRGQMRLLNARGAVLLEVSYRDDPPWPAAPAGAGASLALSRPSLGERNPHSWRASARLGGSPGADEPVAEDPLSALVINEALASGAAQSDNFVELFNTGPVELDAAGCVLTGDLSSPGYTVPAATKIPPGGFLAIGQPQAGFNLAAAGGLLFLYNPSRTALLDALKFGPQGAGLSAGRFPNGGGEWRALSAPTRAASNERWFAPDVVINEIMYHPISDDSDDEYVELYNSSKAQADLSGWKLTGAIRFTFPNRTLLPGGGYLVVARNAARMLTNYSHLNSQNTLSNFQGRLSDSGERLALTRADGVSVDEVEYGTGGRWGQWADGGGSSLELIHPDSDHLAASSWADSDETSKAAWTSLAVAGTLTNYIGAVPTALGTLTNIQLVALGKSELLLDDVEVIPANSTNIVINSTFSSNLLSWRGLGTHRNLSAASNGYSDNSSLRVSATDRGDPLANRVFGSLRRALQPGTKVEIKAKLRWQRGAHQVVLRTGANTLEAYGKMQVPQNLGTPGLLNSRAALNTFPVVTEVEHSPLVPQGGQTALIRARISARAGVRQASLYYRVDPGTTTNVVEMNDSGRDGDALAGDGIYTAALPPQASRSLVSFYVTARDQRDAVVAFPSDAPNRGCLVRYGEPASQGSFPSYRIWMTKATQDAWTAREKTSNDPLDVTFVYNDSRVVYGAGAFYSGSGFNSAGLTSPVGTPCDYEMQFPDDDLVLGSSSMVLAWPGLTGYPDSTAQNEQAAFWLAGQMGLPFNYRRYVRVIVNGVQRNAIMEDSQRPNRDMVEQWFPDDSAGDLYKMQLYYEVNAADAGVIMSLASLSDYKIPDESQRRARYRWNWGKRAGAEDMNDFKSLNELIQAINTPEDQGYIGKLENLADVDQWLKTMAVERFVGNWDSFGYANEQNMYFYKPEQGRWQLMMWDIDIAFANVIAEPATTDLFTHVNRLFTFTADPITQRFFKHPLFRRRYLRALNELVNGPVLKLNALLDAKYAAFTSGGVTTLSPAAIKTYAATRRTLTLNTIARFDPAFSITSPAPDFTTEAPELLVQGSAPLAMEKLRIDGLPTSVVWLTPTNWTVRISLTKPTNTFEIIALDAGGAIIPSATRSLLVRFQGQKPEFSSFMRTSEGLQLTWSAVAGKTYGFQSTTSLSPPTWVDLPGSTTATSAAATRTISLPVNGRMFYRLRVLP